jgi:signal transduction histidine kinase
MNQNVVEHMFERFYRADEARNFNGTGLGLSIAKLIVDKHNGHFEIVSREQLGTRIDIVLPRLILEQNTGYMIDRIENNTGNNTGNNETV